MNITKRTGLYYWVEGDERRHFDNSLASELQATVPNYWEDTCPVCGNKENIDGCRCYINHRYCKCGAVWHWDLDKVNAKMVVIIETNPLTKV
jgi:hypothetical protein